MRLKLFTTLALIGIFVIGQVSNAQQRSVEKESGAAVSIPIDKDNTW